MASDPLVICQPNCTINILALQACAIADDLRRSRICRSRRPHSYGRTSRTYLRRAAAKSTRFCAGAKPGDLPVEQPTKFELVINLKTAKALGLKRADKHCSLRADEVIE